MSNVTPESPSKSIRNGVFSSAGIGTLLMGLTRCLDKDKQEIAALCVPILSGVLSYIGVYFYCRWMEPHELVSLKSGLKRDLAEQKSIIDDSYADEQTREQARRIYSATKMKLATLRQDFISGKYSITVQVNTTPQE